jgi:hypothetical protein
MPTATGQTAAAVKTTRKVNQLMVTLMSYPTAFARNPLPVT